MDKKDKIEQLLISLLESIGNATNDSSYEMTDAGKITSVEFRFMPAVEFTEEDVELIRELSDDYPNELEDLLEYLDSAEEDVY